MKPIITDSSSLERFREKGAVYVDKTAKLYDLITSESSDNYFIARPRRFGKSLMISTFEAIFKGRRELFKGLAIDSLDYDWKVYPVLRFDFSRVSTDTLEIFSSAFQSVVKDSLTAAGYGYEDDKLPETNFASAIVSLSEKFSSKVVILIDEYDAPVGHSLNDIEKAEKIRDRLSAFYIQIKGYNAYVRFMMMTGVSKFTQLSVFSALNNLTDLTVRQEAADLLGYSPDDLENFFGEHMRAHAVKMGLTYEKYREELARWNDGYRFSPDIDIHMYNPFAIANTLVMNLPYFRSTWASTGRPSFLARYFNREALLEKDWECIKYMTDSIFDAADLGALRPETVLLQAGYLTIKESDGLIFSLGIPNQEIRQDLNSFLLEIQATGNRVIERDEIGGSLANHDFKAFEMRVKSFYAGLPYGSREKEIRQSEFSYARIFNALLQGYGFELRPEDTQTCGRADLVAKSKKGTYVFEFKVDKSAQVAIDQIKAKDYAAPFRNRGLPIFAIGINFDSETARINDFIVEEI